MRGLGLLVLRFAIGIVFVVHGLPKLVPVWETGPAQASALLEAAERRLGETGENIAACKFRAALGAAMGLAQEANRYLDQKAPWLALKSDKADAATTLWVGLAVVNCLKTALYPFLPFSSQKLHDMLGFEGDVRDQGWTWSPDMLKPEQELATPEPLFAKLDEALIEEETQRIGR